MARKKKQASLPSYPEFAEKWAKLVPEHWVPAAEAMDRDEMETHITECEMTIEANAIAKAEDTTIQDLKDKLKALNEGYSGWEKTQQAKIKFMLHLMNLRGYNVKVHKATDSVDEDDD